MQAGAITIRFPEALRLRVPRGLPAAVATAARRHHTSAPEWVRQTLLRSLEAEGVRLRDGEIEVTSLRNAVTLSLPALVRVSAANTSPAVQPHGNAVGHQSRVPSGSVTASEQPCEWPMVGDAPFATPHAPPHCWALCCCTATQTLRDSPAPPRREPTIGAA